MINSDNPIGRICEMNFPIISSSLKNPEVLSGLPDDQPNIFTPLKYCNIPSNETMVIVNIIDRPKYMYDFGKLFKM